MPRLRHMKPAPPPERKWEIKLVVSDKGGPSKEFESLYPKTTLKRMVRNVCEIWFLEVQKLSLEEIK